MSDPNAPLILYVEDDAPVLELGVTALEEGGFQVKAVQSGPDAIAALENPDAVIRALVTDIDLPGGISGWDIWETGKGALSRAARHLRQRRQLP